MLKIVCAVLLLASVGWAENIQPSEGEFNGALFEGDIILPPNLSRAGRKTNRWPGGVFYYRLTRAITSQSRAMQAIRAAIQDWEAKTCIRFKERTNEPAFVEFVTGRGGCWSNGIGRNGNRMQTINLDSGCWNTGTVVHEIGHALGFWHEQARKDRDEYITILWQNIKSGMDSQFRKVTESHDYDVPYDLKSVMHYPKWAFQKSRGKNTIEVKPEHGGASVVIGQRNGLSERDALQMNRMYASECGSGPATRPTVRPTQPTVRPTEGGSCVDKNTNCKRWARYCADSRYEKFMRNNCLKTCNFCQVTGQCKDTDTRCQNWTSYCNNNDYVKKNCKRTCKRC